MEWGGNVLTTLGPTPRDPEDTWEGPISAGPPRAGCPAPDETAAAAGGSRGAAAAGGSSRGGMRGAGRGARARASAGFSGSQHSESLRPALRALSHNG